MRWLLLASALSLAACNADKIAQLERQNQELATKLDAMSKQTNLDLQEKCAKGAREEFISQRWVSDASFTDHYSRTLNKCFIEVKWFEFRKSGPYPGQYTHVFLSDAFEKKDYGEFANKTGELKPLKCTVIATTGKEVDCNSLDEFDKLAKPYMEE